MYKSPIDLMRTMQTQIETDIETHVLTAIERVGVHVDKDELIKALQYDRNQYDKGFDDGRKETAKEVLQELKNRIVKAIYQYYNENGGGYYLAEDVIDDINDIAYLCGVEVE